MNLSRLKGILKGVWDQVKDNMISFCDDMAHQSEFMRAKKQVVVPIYDNIKNLLEAINYDRKKLSGINDHRDFPAVDVPGDDAMIFKLLAAAHSNQQEGALDRLYHRQVTPEEMRDWANGFDQAVQASGPGGFDATDLMASLLKNILLNEPYDRLRNELNEAGLDLRIMLIPGGHNDPNMKLVIRMREKDYAPDAGYDAGVEKYMYENS